MKEVFRTSNLMLFEEGRTGVTGKNLPNWTGMKPVIKFHMRQITGKLHCSSHHAMFVGVENKLSEATNVYINLQVKWTQNDQWRFHYNWRVKLRKEYENVSVFILKSSNLIKGNSFVVSDYNPASS